MKLFATAGIVALGLFLFTVGDTLDPAFAARALGIGLVGGLAGGLVAGAIGLISVPLIVIGLGLPIHAALATNLFQTTFTAASGALRHRGLGNVDLRLTAPLLAGAVLGAPIGVYVSLGLPEAVLRRIFVVLLLLMAASLLRRVIQGRQKGRKSWMDLTGASWLGRRIQGEHRGESYAVPWALPVVLGVGLGFVSGLLGVGGGFLVTPAVAGILQLPTHLSIGTGLTVIAGNSLFGTVPHLIAGRVVIIGGILIAAGGAIGAWIGSHWGSRLPERVLDAAFIVVLAAVAWRLA